MCTSTCHQDLAPGVTWTVTGSKLSPLPPPLPPLLLSPWSSSANHGSCLQHMVADTACKPETVQYCSLFRSDLSIMAAVYSTWCLK